MANALALTNLGKLYWPKEKITKGQLIEYYERISPFILPYLKKRPLSLKRNPNGIRDNGFYQKDAIDIVPDWMKTSDFYSPSAKKIIHYLVCNKKTELLFIANLGCIEMNPWSSTVDAPDNPDYLAIDIDPSDKNTFDQVVETALAIKDICDRAKLDTFCKTSGASGLHIFLPCRKKYDYDTVREFAHLIAIKANEQLPKLTTLERSLSKRKKTEIYIDYLQNSRGQTLASAYSARPRPGATVSTPLDWKEVKSGLDPLKFNLQTVPDRVAKKGDLFKQVLGPGIDLKRARQYLE